MANLTTTADLKFDVLQRCGELTNGASKYDSLVVDYLDRVHKEIICGGSTFVEDLCEPWEWARSASPGLLVLKPPFDSAGATVANLSTAGTWSVAPDAALGSFAGRFIWFYGYSDVYRIATHTAGSASFTLDMAWQGPALSANPMRCVQLDYTLGGNIARLVEPIRIFRLQYWGSDGEGKVEGISTDQLGRRFPPYLFGMMPYAAPTHFAKISEVNGTPTIRFNMCPESACRVEYEWVPIPADLTVGDDPTTDPLPLVPRADRSVLSLGACFWLMLDKEDPRQDTYMTLTQRKIQAMLQTRRREYDDESKDFAKLNPRLDDIWRPVPRSTSGLWFP